MRRSGYAVLAVGAAALSGCAMPAAVQLAMMAGTVTSVGTTGKGLTDHAASMLTDEDCSFLHFLEGNGYCVALAERDRGVTVAIAAVDSEPTPVHAIAPAAGSPRATEPSLYVVIGSFRNAGYAEATRRRFADLPVQVAHATVHGAEWLRVLAGPYDSAGAATTRKGLAESGVPGAWPLRLCADTLGPPPCRLPNV